MRVFLSSVTLLLASISPSFCQEQLNFGTDFEVDWESIDINNDSITKKLAFTNSTLEFRYGNFPELLHIINLNNDLYPDAIFYWPENSSEPIFEVYINNKGILELILERRGTITEMEANKLNGQLRFTLNEFGYSSPPFLNRIHNINILTSKNDLQSETTIHFGGTDIPLHFNIYQRFKVIQPKYRLRKTPIIKDNNVICELSEGDTGLAIASRTDETGRVWWFVIADNNIKKNTTDYFYIDSESPDGLNYKMLGWISSSYVQKTQ